jgi:hypothetical protein
MASWTINADTTRNRLYLKPVDVGDAEDLDRLENEVFAAARQLRKDFDIVNDLSETKVMSDVQKERVAAIQKTLGEMGARWVVRVAPGATVGMQFRRAGKGAYLYEVMVASSLEEAEYMLAERAKAQT